MGLYTRRLRVHVVINPMFSFLDTIFALVSVRGVNTNLGEVVFID
jgi:hypothetical protein